METQLGNYEKFKEPGFVQDVTLSMCVRVGRSSENISTIHEREIKCQFQPVHNNLKFHRRQY